MRELMVPWSEDDIEELERDLEFQGASEDEIAEWRKQYDRSIVVETWPGQLQAISVYMLCIPRLDYMAPGFAPKKIITLRGQIDAEEIESVCRALKVEFDGDVLWAVRVMASEAIDVHNARQA